MARLRFIKPGIMTNEELCELGMPAYILFTGLWMLADREGRLEYRPRRIKAQAMPLWDEVSAKDVEDLLKKLENGGFIQIYNAGTTKAMPRHDLGSQGNADMYIAIISWKKHQHPHSRESASQIPPPPTTSANGSAGRTSASKNRTTKVVPRHDLGDAEPGGLQVQSKKSSRRKERGCGGEGNRVSTTTEPPDPQPQNSPQAAAVDRKPPGRAEPQHSAEDLRFVTDSLSLLAREVGLPPPDAVLVCQVIDAYPGATGEQIHAALVALHKRNKFRSIRTWGLVPLVLRQAVAAAS